MNKKLDTIIYILGLVVVGLLLVGIINVFASDPYGEVKDNNNGNLGYILVSTGQNQGSQSIGHWTDVNDIPNLKGDKGDKGDTGLQGIQGLTGLQGIAGLNGIQGIAGLNGIDGIDGINGINGLDGLKGDTGEQGIQGFAGEQGIQGEKGDRGLDVDPQTVIDLQNTDTQLNNSIIDEVNNRIFGDNSLFNLLNTETINSQNRDIALQGNINNEGNVRATADTQLQSNINSVNSRVDNVERRVSKLEETQYNIRTEVKFIREKHLEVGVYSTYSTNRNTCAEVGLNIVIPIGEGYQDRENKKINARLDRLEQKTGTATVIERTLDNQGRIKSISISEGQLAVSGKF